MSALDEVKQKVKASVEAKYKVKLDNPEFDTTSGGRGSVFEEDPERRNLIKQINKVSDPGSMRARNTGDDVNDQLNAPLIQAVNEPDIPPSVPMVPTPFQLGKNALQDTREIMSSTVDLVQTGASKILPTLENQDLTHPSSIRFGEEDTSNYKLKPGYHPEATMSAKYPGLNYDNAMQAFKADTDTEDQVFLRQFLGLEPEDDNQKQRIQQHIDELDAETKLDKQTRRQWHAEDYMNMAANFAVEKPVTAMGTLSAIKMGANIMGLEAGLAKRGGPGFLAAIEPPKVIMDRHPATRILFKRASDVDDIISKVTYNNGRYFDDLLGGYSKADQAEIFKMLNGEYHTKNVIEPGNLMNQATKRISSDFTRHDLIPVHDEIRKYLDTTFKDINRVRKSLGKKPIEKLDNYISHLFHNTMDREQIGIRGTPSSTMNKFLKEREGSEGYKRDLLGALKAYDATAQKSIHLDPVLHDADRLMKKLPRPLAEYTQGWVDHITGKPGVIEKNLVNGFRALPGIGKKIPHNAISSIVNAGLGFMYRGTLGANLGSAITNLTQNVNTFAFLGPKATMKGFMALGTKRGQQIAKLALRDYKLLPEYKYAGHKIIKGLDNALMAPFQGAEELNRSVAALSGYFWATERGASPKMAREIAKQMHRITQFDYRTVNTPTLYRDPIMKGLLAFGRFSTEQIGFVKNMGQNKRTLLKTIGKKPTNYDIMAPYANYIASTGGLIYAGHQAGINLTNTLGPKAYTPNFLSLTGMTTNYSPSVQILSDFWNKYYSSDEFEKERAGNKLNVPMDADNVADFWDKLGKDFKIFVPGGVALDKARKVQKALNTGEYKDPITGNVTRKVTNPNSEIGRVFNLMPDQDAIDDYQIDKMIEIRNKARLNRSELMKEMQDAIVSDDTQKMDQVFKKLEAIGVTDVQVQRSMDTKSMSTKEKQFAKMSAHNQVETLKELRKAGTDITGLDLGLTQQDFENYTKLLKVDQLGPKDLNVLADVQSELEREQKAKLKMLKNQGRK